MKNRSLLILALLVLALCVGAICYLQFGPDRGTQPLAEMATPAPAPAPATPPSKTLGSTATPKPLAIQEQKKVAPAQPPPAWEAKIEQVLTSNLGEAEIAKVLINMLPSLPPDGQSEAAQHISNLLEDKDYSRVLPLVKNPNLPEEVLDVFVTDLMNRDDAVKLPVLLEIAKTPNHPHHEEAQTDLEIFLDEDYGNDWPKWERAMKDYLKKQAEENAADAATQPPVSGAPPPRVRQ